MIYQAINFDSFNDGASEVNFDDNSALPSRIGARLARTWAVEEASGDKPARLATVWGRVNLWYNFLDDSVTTTFSSANGFVPFTAELEDSWIEADFGGTVELTATTSLYGNVDFATSFDGDANSIGGKLGLRMNW
jgi:outer membrane autotransporter protein